MKLFKIDFINTKGGNFMLIHKQWQEKEPPPGYYEEKPTYNQLANETLCL